MIARGTRSWLAAAAGLGLLSIGGTAVPANAQTSGDWTFINVDLTNAPAGYLEAESLEHPVWQDVFNKYKNTSFCYGYKSPNPPTSEPYSTSFNAMLEGSFRLAETYLVNEGFEEIQKRRKILSSAMGAGIKPIFCSDGALAPVAGISLKVFGALDVPTDPLKSAGAAASDLAMIRRGFADNSRERSWQLAAANRLTRIELYEAQLGVAQEHKHLEDKDFERGTVWIGPSGIADGVAVRAVEQQYGEEFGDYNDLQDRISYLPMKADLPIYRNNRADDQNLTAGAFWWFVADQYLDRDSELIDGVKQILASPNTMKAVDDWLDSIDGPNSHGFETIYPQFVAHYLGWAEHRFNGGVSEETWLEDAIGGCKRLTVSEADPVAKLNVKINEYGSVCLEVEAIRDSESWAGAATISLYAPDDKADDIYAAHVKHIVAAAASSNESSILCAKRFDAKSNARFCMAIPEQGVAKEDGRLFRYLHMDDIDLGESTRSGTFRLILSYVPSDHRPITSSTDDDRSVEFEIVMSADLAILTADVFEDGPGQSTYGAKVGLTPVAPLPDRQITGADMVAGGSSGLPGLAIFEGDGVGIDPNLFQSAMASAAQFILLEDESGNGVTIPVPDAIIPGNGPTGEIPVFPVFALAGHIAIPDPDNLQTINILTNEFDSFHFEADFSLCMMSQAELMAQGLAGKEPDICLDGERKDVAATVAIPYPSSFDPERSLVPARTENFLNLRAMRLSAIAERFGISESSTDSTPRPGSQPDNEPGTRAPSGSPTGQPAGTARSCSLRDLSGVCDCSCEAQVCYAEKSAASRLLGSDKACRLTCGKKWAACSN